MLVVFVQLLGLLLRPDLVVVALKQRLVLPGKGRFQALQVRTPETKEPNQHNEELIVTRKIIGKVEVSNPSHQGPAGFHSDFCHPLEQICN